MGAITRVQFSKLMNIAALKGKGPVDRPLSQSFSRVGAQMLIVSLRMILQAHLHALVGLIIGLCFAQEDLHISLLRWLKV
jgi:hypothetical protein